MGAGCICPAELGWAAAIGDLCPHFTPHQASAQAAYHGERNVTLSMGANGGCSPAGKSAEIA